MSPDATNPEPHPAATVWPMLPKDDLRRLADDIGEKGLLHPIVLDSEGRILDGRNRLAACELAGVEPTFETYDGDDPEAFVLSSNNERRHLSLPERAAATALTLALAGKRKAGRWARGSIPDPPDSTGSGNTWQARMTEAGLVLDYLGEVRLRRVADGKSALDAEVTAAKKVKAERARISDLPDDLRVLVEADELSVVDAERRAKLAPRYAEMVESGALTLEEAETLATEEERAARARRFNLYESIRKLASCAYLVRSEKDIESSTDLLTEWADEFEAEDRYTVADVIEAAEDLADGLPSFVAALKEKRRPTTEPEDQMSAVDDVLDAEEVGP